LAQGFANERKVAPPVWSIRLHLFLQRAARVGATTRDLNRSFRVLATLAAIFFVLWYGASASRM